MTNKKEITKKESAYRTIGEAAAELDVPTHVLRFWETKFKQIQPVKRAGGRRYYRPEDMAILHEIQKLLHTQGFTIKGAQNYLKDKNKIDLFSAAGVDTQPDYRALLVEALQELKELRQSLNA